MLAVALTLSIAAAPPPRPLEAFTVIHNSGSWTLDVRAGEKHTVAVDAEDPAEAAQLVTVVEKGALKIHCSDPCRIKKKLTVLVATPALDALNHSGSGSVAITDVKSRKLSLNASGSGALDWRGSVDELLLNLGGSGKATLTGKSARLELSLGGSGEIDAAALEVREAKVAIRGSGRALVHATDELDAAVSGSGRVYYLGKPKVRKAISGSGRVEPKENKKASSGW